MAVKMEVKSSDYKAQLMDDHNDVIHLYKVTIIKDGDKQTVYVLAATRNDAESQATCEFWPNQSSVVCVTEKVPFRIHGWNTITF